MFIEIKCKDIKGKLLSLKQLKINLNKFRSILNLHQIAYPVMK
jgi:hypothetical protein